MVDHATAAGSDEQASVQEREVKPAMFRGWKRRCPNCGKGPIMKSYLKVRDACLVCNEDLHHHRADDGPAYLTILIVGHIMAPLLIWVFTTFRPEPMILAIYSFRFDMRTMTSSAPETT